MPARNDAALAFLKARRSRSAKLFSLPVPSRPELEEILAAAARVPDHGKLEPWRLVVVQGAAFARLADLAEARAQERGGDPEMVAKALLPDYALGSHTASLGLASSVGTTLPQPFSNGMFIGQHGSWNRRPHSGYKVIYVPFANGKPSGPPVDVLTGFLSAEATAYGRPVGVALDKTGALLVADDVGNIIWRVHGK